MSDYIKRTDALGASKIVYIEYIEIDNEGYEIGDAEDIPVIFKRDLEKLPAADVRENVHAHWYHMPETYGAFCSNCHSWQYPDMVFQTYCPSCGAIMDEEVRP